MMHKVTLGADQLDDVIKFCAGDAGDQVNPTLVRFQLEQIQMHQSFWLKGGGSNQRLLF